ncbi:DNA recombination protein RmuC [Fontivita pretiosa]|uniref:DNA recombination protein RmuC n=1 Tax=Fontivita pretiosa TaxID=2989684 RepID=UPI003D1831E1
MAWIVGILGFGLGAVVAYLLAERRCRGLIADLQRQCAVLEEKLGAREQELLRQQALLDTAEARLREAFASLSSDALQRNNEAFLNLAREKFAALSAEAVGSLEQRKAQIEGLLKPMQELLNTYQARLAELEKSRVESYSMLREQLGTLAETQRTLSLQTTQLVTALRRPTTRGQWGEITLRRLVELAGLSSRCDFIEQASVDTEDGRQRPDMIVHLPGDRQIVIDCKVSLDAFLDAAAAPDEDNRRACLARHARQVRSRAVELGAKSYWNQFKRSPEYVVMFLPGEAFLYAAVEQDGTLIEDCLKNRVIVATPTTLIALLKAIEFGWRQEQIAENAEEIRKHGKDLYDRIAVLATHFSRLGASLEQSVKCYNELLGSLESRVMVTARKIGELGARSDRELPDLSPIDRQPREPSATLGAVSEST